MEKLDRIPDDKRYYDESDFVKEVIEKINMIIDYLNTQPQARVFTEFTDKNISDDIPKGFVDIDGKLHKFEYNPEQKEEWEKEFELPDEIENEDCIEVLADKHKLWNICSWEEPELDPDKVVAFIKQLLEERECRAREEGRREQQKLDCELYGTAVATDEEVEEMWKTKLERMRDKYEDLY